MLKLKPSVQAAIDEGKPVVALESTIIAHGLPYPDNLNLARNIERLIEMHGATPATIAVIAGEMCVGLEADVLERFAKEGLKIPKLSTRDLPIVVAQKLSGATTVSSTMRIAEMAGIAVFATGGIGGAHRGVSSTFDISNDLFEFTQSSVAVVTAGAKAILDLAVTLEVLETYGVPVVGYGTEDFPAFYSRMSGHRVPMRCNTAREVATLMKTKWDMAMPGGIVVANPINPEFEIPNDKIAPAIEIAIKQADEKNISGKHLTPYLLGRIAEITQGQSVRANMALAMNNAKLAAEIAVAYAGLRNE